MGVGGNLLISAQLSSGISLVNLIQEVPGQNQHLAAQLLSGSFPLSEKHVPDAGDKFINRLLGFRIFPVEKATVPAVVEGTGKRCFLLLKSVAWQMGCPLGQD